MKYVFLLVLLLVIFPMRWPRVAHEAYRVDYGPRWAEGVITIEPPRLGAPFPVRVPQVDADGKVTLYYKKD